MSQTPLRGVKTIKADPRKIYCAESDVSGFCVNNLKRALRAGCKFPPIGVTEFEGELYLFLDERIKPCGGNDLTPDGGKHRLMAYLKEGFRELNFEIYEFDWLNSFEKYRIINKLTCDKKQKIVLQQQSPHLLDINALTDYIRRCAFIEEYFPFMTNLEQKLLEQVRGKSFLVAMQDTKRALKNNPLVNQILEEAKNFT